MTEDVTAKSVRLYQEGMYETIDLTPLNPMFEGLYVKVLKPPLMKRMDYITIWGPADSLGTDDDSMKSLAERTGRKLAATIVEWNIPNFETGDPLPIPKDDMKSLDALPGIVVEFVFARLMAVFSDWTDKLGEALGDGEKS